MNMNEYQEACMQTARWPAEQKMTYPLLAMCGEAGECANEWKKYLRGDYNKVSHTVPDTLAQDLAHELGDVLYYVAAAAHDLGFSLEDIARMNREKLQKRYAATAKG